MNTQPTDEIQVGDLVLVHGFVCEVIELVEGLGIIYRNPAGEAVAYNAKWPCEPAPKRIWILEQ